MVRTFESKKSQIFLSDLPSPWIEVPGGLTALFIQRGPDHFG